MEFRWPAFTARQDFHGRISWTAEFDSYDQYRELCCYRAQIFDGARPAAAVTVTIGTEYAGDDWTTPAFERGLRERIARAVAAHLGL